MKALPKKFEFCTKVARADKYVAEQAQDGYYYVHKKDVFLEDAFDAPLKYSTTFVTAAVTDGMWIVEKDLDEPELVLPLTVVHEVNVDRPFVVSEGFEKGYVDCKFLDNGDEYKNVHHFDSVKSLIKIGTWIVKHVGPAVPEKAEEQPAKIIYEDGPLSVDADKLMTFKVPESPSKLSLTVECNTDAAVANIERLRQAVEDLNVAMESYISLKKEMANV